MQNLISLFYIYFVTIKICHNVEFNAEEPPNHLARQFSLSLSSPYDNWDTLGSTLASDKFIRLTSAVKSQSGAIWNKYNCPFKYWRADIEFKVQGVQKGLFGDGFVFWYARDRMQSGPVYGNRDYFAGVAIIADTYSNHNGEHRHEHPYVSAMVNNGTLHYDHDRDGTHTQLGGCTWKFRNTKMAYMSVIYYKDTLEVRVTRENGKSEVCLSVNGVVLPTGYFFGMSASTGDLFDVHEVHAIRVFDLTPTLFDEDRSKLSPSATYFEAPRDHVDDPKPSTLSMWKKVFLLIFGVLAICGCVIIGGLFYTKHQENSRKRFY